jgi:hypothetical protein
MVASPAQQSINIHAASVNFNETTNPITGLRFQLSTMLQQLCRAFEQQLRVK